MHTPRALLASATLASLLVLAACGGDEGRSDLQVLSSCHLPPMAELQSPITNWPQSL